MRRHQLGILLYGVLHVNIWDVRRHSLSNSISYDKVMTHIDISVNHVHPLEIGPILMALVPTLLHAFCQSNDCWTALLPDHLKLGNNAFFFKFWLSTCQNASLVDGSGPWAAMNSRRDEKPWKNVNWIFQYLVLLTAIWQIFTSERWNFCTIVEEQLTGMKLALM